MANPTRCFKLGLKWVLLLGATLGCLAQQQTTGVSPTANSQQTRAEAGLESAWDVNKTLANLNQDNEQLQRTLAQLNPQQWHDQKGASTTYILQWQAAQHQVNDVIYTTRQFSQKTDSLSLALDTYFRLEALEVTARSLEQGAQNYAPRALADTLGEVIAHNFNNRERLRDYLRELATSTEQNFKIADEEAQRCRTALSKEPPPRTKSKKY